MLRFMSPNLLVVLRAYFDPPDQVYRLRVNFYMQHGEETAQLAGHLYLSVGEWQLVGAALTMGAGGTHGHLAVEVREDPLANPQQ